MKSKANKLKLYGFNNLTKTLSFNLTVHTYPESHLQKGIMTFLADIDVSTCGRISPLNALNYLLDSFDSYIVTLDYRVRGFTRDVNGKKLFIDHRINSIRK